MPAPILAKQQWRSKVNGLSRSTLNGFRPEDTSTPACLFSGTGKTCENPNVLRDLPEKRAAITLAGSGELKNALHRTSSVLTNAKSGCNRPRQS